MLSVFTSHIELVGVVCCSDCNGHTPLNNQRTLSPQDSIKSYQTLSARGSVKSRGGGGGGGGQGAADRSSRPNSVSRQNSFSLSRQNSFNSQASRPGRSPHSSVGSGGGAGVGGGGGGGDGVTDKQNNLMTGSTEVNFTPEDKKAEGETDDDMEVSRCTPTR